MFRTYSDYTTDTYYASVSMAERLGELLSIGDKRAVLGITELKIVGMYEDLLEYIQYFPTFLTQAELISICNFLNGLTGNNGQIDLATINSTGEYTEFKYEWNNDFTVSNWGDQTTNKYNATQSNALYQPALGTTAITFESADFMDTNQVFQRQLRSSFSFAMKIAPSDGMPVASKVLCGFSNTTTGYSVQVKIGLDGKLSLFYGNTPTNSCQYNTTSAVFADGANALHSFVISVTEGSGMVFYTDGVLEASVYQDSVQLSDIDMDLFTNTTISMYIGANNVDDVATDHPGVDISSLAFISKAMTATEALNYHKYGVTP